LFLFPQGIVHVLHWKSHVLECVWEGMLDIKSQLTCWPQMKVNLLLHFLAWWFRSKGRNPLDLAIIPLFCLGVRGTLGCVHNFVKQAFVSAFFLSSERWFTDDGRK
jgi:hypothetical protein